jgi:hypothetical protein
MSNLPPHIQAIIDAQSKGAVPQTADAPVAVAAPVQPAFNPNVIPALNNIPDQQSKGPRYLPWNEVYDVRATLHQLRHRAPTERSGPRFEATFTVTRTDVASTVMANTERAVAFFYNPYAYGKDKDASDRNLRDFKEFVAGCMGQGGQKDFDADAAASQLLALSIQIPSLGIPIRLLNQEDGTSKTTGKTFYKRTTLLAVD